MRAFLTAVPVLAAAIAGAGASTIDPDWVEFQAFVEKYNRIHASPAEAAGRFAIFKENLATIAARNQKGGETHGVNQFADISPEEFKRWYLGHVKQNSTFAKPIPVPIGLGAPASVDWRTKGAVTPVKNQGQCGSCWAFSATQQIESEYFLKYGALKVLAPQQITSCDTNDLGCNGGNPMTAYGYVQGAGGLELEKDYPYTSGTTSRTGTCKFNKQDVEADLKDPSYVSSSPAQEGNMFQQIQNSPMSVCVDAETWQTYVGGIVKSGSCGTSLDHAVQAVGYNAEQNYWIVRNSWGPSWGNGGYIWVEAGHNVCGIAQEVTIVEGAKPTAKDDVVV